MTRDEVIAMARKADFDGWLQRVMLMAPEVLERFAALVAAAEREACAQVCDEIQRTKAHKFYGQLLSDGSARQAAAAIRSRSTK